MILFSHQQDVYGLIFSTIAMHLQLKNRMQMPIAKLSNHAFARHANDAYYAENNIYIFCFCKAIRRVLSRFSLMFHAFFNTLSLVIVLYLS